MFTGQLLPSPWHFAAPAGPDSPLGNYLRDPGGAVHAVLVHVAQWVTVWWPVAGPVLVLAAFGFGGARWWWRRRCRRMLNADARIVSVLPPPTADPAGAEALWANLLGLLRPAWRRRLTGQPHVAWEYAFDRETIHVRLWVPGASRRGWSSARSSRPGPAPAPAPPPHPPPRRAAQRGRRGELRLARPEALPIRTNFPADPIRALLGAPVGLGPSEQAVVQILARPVTGRRITRARRAARRARAGQPVRPVSRLLDLLTPGYRAPRSRRAAPVLDRQTALEASAEDKVIVAKQRGAPYETRIRYAITATVPEDLSREKRAAVRERLRGRGHALASAFAAFTEHNYYRRAKLRRPRLYVAERRLHKGDLLSIPELAAVAHLPWDEAIPGLQRAGARAVPPRPASPPPARP